MCVQVVCLLTFFCKCISTVGSSRCTLKGAWNTIILHGCMHGAVFAIFCSGTLLDVCMLMIASMRRPGYDEVLTSIRSNVSGHTSQEHRSHTSLINLSHMVCTIMFDSILRSLACVSLTTYPIWCWKVQQRVRWDYHFCYRTSQVCKRICTWRTPALRHSRLNSVIVRPLVTC